MRSGQTTQLIPVRPAPPDGAAATLSPVSVSSHAAVETASRLQSLAALCAARLVSQEGREDVKLMLAWLDGYEASHQSALASMREQLQGLGRVPR